MYSRPVKEVFFTAFDLETTGLYPAKDKIIEIGAIKFNLKGAQYRFSGLINPGCGIPDEASGVNGITDDMVEGKPLIQEILPGFIDFIDETVLVAHNIDFDTGFIVAAADSLRIPLADNLCIDTIEFGKRYYRGLYSYSLGNLSRALGIEIKNAHRAEDDAEACMNIFKKCLAKVPDYPGISLKELFKSTGLKMRTLNREGISKIRDF